MMNKLFILTSVVVAFAFVNASATIINVPADYDTIQVAINASSDGDTVLVSDGHYYERINFYGKGILLTSEFILDGDTMHIQNTIIDADTLVLGVADTGSVVCFVNGEDSTSIIQGFSLQNGIGIIGRNNLRRGGGIYCNESSPSLSNNAINENSANRYGGGIYCKDSYAIISNNTISGNYADWGGGILCTSNSYPIISNNTISGNYADWGGGIYCNDSDPVVVNTILWANIADSGNNGIHVVVVALDSISITYSDIQGGWAGEGNIDVDPLFCLLDTAYYRLAENSPCVGSGQNGENMGAYGIGCEATDIFENDFVLPMQFSLSQNYPNPFNPTTTITFSLPMQQHVTLMIYNLLGKEVQTLVNEQRQAGMHTVRFDASELSSGIYFYRLQAGDYSETKRMVLLK